MAAPQGGRCARADAVLCRDEERVALPVAAQQSEVTEVSWGWSLTPAGFEPGDESRLPFSSARERDAASTNIAAFNTFSQNRAAAGHADIQSYRYAGYRAGSRSAAPLRPRAISGLSRCPRVPGLMAQRGCFKISAYCAFTFDTRFFTHLRIA